MSSQPIQSLIDQWASRPKVLNYENQSHLEWNSGLLLALKAAIADITIQNLSTAHTPSNAAPPAPETERNTRTQAATPHTDGTAAAPDHKSGSDGKSSSAVSKLDAARKASAKRVFQSPAKSSKTTKARKPSESPTTLTATPASDGF